MIIVSKIKDRFKYNLIINFTFCFIIFLCSTQYAFGFSLGDALNLLPFSLPIPSFLQPIIQPILQPILQTPLPIPSFLQPVIQSIPQKPVLPIQNQGVSTGIPTVLNGITNPLLKNIGFQNPSLQSLVGIASAQNLPFPINVPSNVTDIASLLKLAGVSSNNNLLQSVLPQFLALINTSSPFSTITTLISTNPETGLQDIVGTVLQGAPSINPFLQLTSSANLIINQTRPVYQSSGTGCLGGADGKTPMPENTQGPQYLGSGTSLWCHNGQWVQKQSNIEVSSATVLPVLDNGQLMGKPLSAPVQLPVTNQLPVAQPPSGTNLPVSPAIDSRGTCTCTCSGDYTGCLIGYTPNDSRGLFCEYTSGTTSVSETRLQSKCSIASCNADARPYANKIAAEHKGLFGISQPAYIYSFNVTCSRFEFK